MAGGDSPVTLGNDMSSILLAASFDGRLKSSEGFLSATGDLCTLTAATGKDLYIMSSKIIFFLNATAVDSVADEAVLKVNGTIVETAKSTLNNKQTASFNAGGNSVFVYEFRNLFHKVNPSEVLKIELITLSANVDVEGFIQAIEVPTGEDPTKYRGD